MPKIVGEVDNAFTAAHLSSLLGRKVTKGVTAIRLLFPEYDPKLIAADLAREVSDYAQRAVKSGAKARGGTIAISPARPRPSAKMVNFFVDGRTVQISNVYPFKIEWDSHAVPNGYHFIEVETILDSVSTPILESKQIFVEN
jgi:hypothetical protein